MNQSDIKLAIYFISLGAALVTYAHSNFGTSKELESLVVKVDRKASSDDITRLEHKIDAILFKLMDGKK